MLYICDMWKQLLLLVFCLFSLSACKQKDVAKSEEETEEELRYFSIKQFIEDQFDLKKGQPYTFRKVVVQNGRSDTTLIPYDKVNWKEVFATFAATDISDPETFGDYDFTNVDDNTLESSMLIYTAKNPKDFTQKLNVGYDNLTGKIGSIYIETKTDEKDQRLTYFVNEKIIISEYTSPEKGVINEKTTMYLFPVSKYESIPVE